MPVIQLVTEIKAPVEICFDLARSIDLHKLSTKGTHEEAIGGVTTGLIGSGEEVTWRAIHFGFRQELTSRITVFKYPVYFCDEMVKGAFKSICHTHTFEPDSTNTIMKDHFEFEVPCGFLGKIFTKVILYDYLRKLLEYRNNVIKEVAESGEWKGLLVNIKT